VGQRQCPYDLLWPVARRRLAQVQAKVEEVNMKLVAKQQLPLGLATTGSLLQLQSYARQLVPTLGHAAGTGEEDEENEMGGCRGAVEVLTRNPRKVSYDIAKDGTKVAVLTFVKPAYRLGETILGVLDFNEPVGCVKVVKFSATLEAHESMPSSLTEEPRQLRRVHAEYHAALVPDTMRTSFSLDIPSDATPAFRISMSKEEEEYLGGLEWKVRMSFLVAVGKRELRHLTKNGTSSGGWGTSWSASASLAPFGRTSEPVPSAGTAGSGWGSVFTSPFLGSGAAGKVVDDEDGGRWERVELQTVECEVGVTVWPGATMFRAVESHFEA